MATVLIPKLRATKLLQERPLSGDALHAVGIKTIASHLCALALRGATLNPIKRLLKHRYRPRAFKCAQIGRSAARPRAALRLPLLPSRRQHVAAGHAPSDDALEKLCPCKHAQPAPPLQQAFHELEIAGLFAQARSQRLRGLSQ
eukprot:CAMPEP_0115876620 /NCGR_PEP_ID=MMETSP0287-20121206/25771_1 /TAXON_ID=412157 /ORGANISM="Chrysochromulina rotalis, Strain UIO044" /LENGTH=143 /DNA_ID=CAMNT_0003332049 /DNA_START=207 /DNA_END=636 /DNA_ORIENTATION=+